MAITVKPSASYLNELKAIPAGFNASYSQLKELIKEKGLLEKQPVFLAQKMIVNALTMIICLVILFSTNNFWIQMLNAVFLAFIFGQTGFISHDAGHRQGFNRPKMNDIFGLLHANLFIGMSFGWWMDKHNQHHAHPNQEDLDPDIDIPVIAFSEEQARTKRGIPRFIVKYQKYFFFPLLLFEAYSLRVGSLGFLFTRESKYRGRELFLIALHFVWYFAVVFAALPFWTGFAFILLHQALFGLYMASVFAPNHKGMLVVPRNVHLDFFRLQVLTARNVKSHPITDFWYGGLNYQIEHHLFPTMARNQLKEAQKIVKDFCQTHGIQYYETSILNSYKEILDYLHIVSTPLRSGKLVKETA